MICRQTEFYAAILVQHTSCHAVFSAIFSEIWQVYVSGWHGLSG